MLLVAAVLLPALLALGVFFIHERAESLTHAYERVALLSRNSAVDLGEMLRDHEAVLGRMAQRPLVKALDARQCDPIIGEYTQLHPAYTNLVVRDLSGRNDCSALARKLAPGQQAVDLVPGYLEAQQRDGLTVGAAHLGPLSGRWVSVLFYPVKDAQNKVSGLISLPMNLLALSERYLGTVAPDDLVLVVDASGRIVMRSRDGGEWVGKPVPETLLLGAAATQGGPFSAPGFDSVARYWAVAPVAGVDWRVLAGVPVEQVMAAPNRALGVGLALVLVCLAAALLAAWRVSLGLVRPIGVLSQVVERVAGGQTALRVPPQTGPREIAAVAQAFNDMLDAREQQTQRRLTLTERVEELSRGLVQAQEETRRRFASELHDRTSPNLAALRINLDFIASASPERRLGLGFEERVVDTRALIEDTTASIREICADLHPSALEGAGLVGAVRGYAYQFGRRTGLHVTVHCQRAERRLAPDLELALFRIVQEAMTNSAKHAQARRLDVTIELFVQPVRVSITDDGVGIRAEQAGASAGASGLGLQTMRETAEFVGGRLNVRAAPGGGTQVTVEMDGV
jgi:signal transduction histidine kinase